ncbi:MAG: hypothetical protein KGI04_01580 [Candidatus Micrarchaeota archaeon]|nr:hypothetical protein [Candidatus Micrarchaeota archaeon]
MTVNPDELLIFKMRGMAAKKQPEGAKATEQAMQTKQKPEPEAKPKKPMLTQKPKPSAAAKPAVREEPLIPMAPLPEEEEAEKPAFYSAEDERRMREVQELEQRVSLYSEPPRGLEAEELEAMGHATKEETNAFSSVAGLLFVANALIFGYFILPQAGFVLGYIAQKGFSTLVLNWSYEYGTSFINLILALLSGVSGLLMLANIKRSHLICGATGSMMLLAVSFEYLTSSALYLLVVTFVTFIGVVALAYARMSAISVVEQEEEAMPMPAEVNWPKIETF